MVGTTLSHYRILAEISRGGMGIVYRALDLKLEREVALKILKPGLVAETDKKARFLQEARATAALYHPHIATVFEIGEADGITFIAMELIGGTSLREALARGPLPVPRAIALATEIAEGLGRAHQKGIVHRDLKPENVMITEDGHAKIIDFGLAKLVDPLGGGGSPDAPTAVRRETDAGTVLGTVTYMSPEQARGEKVDHRTDIFNLGVLLVEMLTGKCPFARASAAETLSAILREAPPRLEDGGLDLSVDVRIRLESVLEKCLAKDRDERYQTAKDLVIDLRSTHRSSDGLSGIGAVGPAPPPRRMRPVVVATAVGLAVAAAVVGLWPRTDAPPRLGSPRQVTAASGVEAYPSWSPEGTFLAYHLDAVDYSGNTDIWLTQPGSAHAVRLTEDHPGADRFPSWSPDGGRIAFWSSRDGGGYFVMPALGGPPRRIAAERGEYPSATRPQWSPDGERIACVVYEGTAAFASVISLATGTSSRIALPGEPGQSRLDLAWSPDGRYFAYVDANNYSSQVTRLLVLDVESGAAAELTEGFASTWSPAWSPDGRYLYYVSNRAGSMDLWRQRIDEGRPRGTPEAVTSGVGMTSAAFSLDGRKLAYSKGRVGANVWRVPVSPERTATWADAEPMTFDEAYVEMIDVSADGTRLALSSDRAGNPDLWLLLAPGGEPRRLTDDPAPDWAPRWSPDGKELAFYFYRRGRREIAIVARDGGPARALAVGAYPDWSPDGRELAFAAPADGLTAIWIIGRDGDGLRQLTDRPPDDFAPAWSPDGGSIAYTSRQTGRQLIWRIPAAGGEAEPLGDIEGDSPRWSPDGEWVFFAGYGADRGVLWAVPASGGGPARPVADLEGRRGRLNTDTLATDGRFLYFSWKEGFGDLWVADLPAP